MAGFLLITMGGTIDSSPYPEQDGQYPLDSTVTGDGHAFQALRNILMQHSGAAGKNLATISVCAKDSKHIDQNDIDRLLSTVNAASNAGYERIIVTCGTDRMCEIACGLLSSKPIIKCPVVFTGAIWPLSNGAKSDGLQNLYRAAFSGVDVAASVYIAMGDVFAPAGNVYKDFERKIFVDRTFINPPTPGPSL